MRHSIFVLVAAAVVSCSEFTSAEDAQYLTLSDSAVSLVVGERRVVGSLFLDSKGRAVTRVVTWASADPTIATVDAGGEITAIAIGVTPVTAVSGALRDSVMVSVRPPAPAVGLSISFQTSTVIVGGVEKFAALLVDSTGHSVSNLITWSTADSNIATVDADEGFVTGIGSGNTSIIATNGTVADTATVSVIRMDAAYSFTRWTPLGDNDYTTDVLLYSPSDGSTRPLERSSQFRSVAAPSWSTDGHILALEVVHGFSYFAPEHWLDFNSDIFIVEAAGSLDAAWRPVTTNGLSRAPMVSSDGARIAYLQQRTLFNENDVYVVRTDGTDPVRVTKTSGAYSPPRWSPDGLRLTFSDWLVEQNNGVFTANADVFVVNADGTGLKNVSQHIAYDTDPSWSPDGRQIAFVSTRASSAADFRHDVYVMDADGLRPPTRLTQLPAQSASPTWSPDGRRILFTSGSYVFMMNADGSSLARLTRPPEHTFDVSPAWKR